MFNLNKLLKRIKKVSENPLAIRLFFEDSSKDFIVNRDGTFQTVKLDYCAKNIISRVRCPKKLDIIDSSFHQKLKCSFLDNVYIDKHFCPFVQTSIVLTA